MLKEKTKKLNKGFKRLKNESEIYNKIMLISAFVNP